MYMLDIFPIGNLPAHIYSGSYPGAGHVLDISTGIISLGSEHYTDVYLSINLM